MFYFTGHDLRISGLDDLGLTLHQQHGEPLGLRPGVLVSPGGGGTHSPGVGGDSGVTRGVTGHPKKGGQEIIRHFQKIGLRPDPKGSGSTPLPGGGGATTPGSGV